MPSFTETFGLVYVEALSQGLPVIYTKGQGFDGQFPEGTVGYHVTPTESKDVAEKILKIAENYMKISSNCNNGIKKYQWKMISEEYLRIYRGIINDKMDVRQ